MRTENLLDIFDGLTKDANAVQRVGVGHYSVPIVRQLDGQMAMDSFHRSKDTTDKGNSPTDHAVAWLQTDDTAITRR